MRSFNYNRRTTKRFRPTAPGMLLLALGLFVLLVRSFGAPVDKVKGHEIQLQVPPSASTAQIATLLQESGVIKNALTFRLYTRIKGLDNQLKPGRYKFQTTMDMSTIANLLVQGPQNMVVVTIPEGYTLAQISKLLEDKGVVKPQDLTRALASGWQYAFLQEVPQDQVGLEGYLYPDTYHLETDADARQVVAIMLEQFDSVLKKHDYLRLVAKQGLTLHEAVTIASMVEKEAKVANERPRIAGVIFNRLKIGMPLQIDATVQYALGQPKEKLYYSDLEVASPYNTYKIKGLPPGPIASPGWSSLQAVVEPQQHDYLYYVAKPDGSHEFARTYEEHKQNIKKYQ